MAVALLTAVAARIRLVDPSGDPGGELERRVVVSNPGAEPRRVSLYPAAATVEDDGFGFAPGETGNELTSWVRVEPASVDLPPGGRATATATIRPSERATTGEHYGVIWAQVAAGAQAQAGVRQIGRAGIRIYLSIGTGGEPPADFEIGGVSAGPDASGARVVSVRITNTGARALDLAGELALSDGPGGLSAGPYPIRMATLAAGASRVVEVLLDATVPEGSWRAALTLAVGRVERTAAATITIGPAGTATGSSWQRPVPLAALTTIGLGGLALLLRRRRGRS